MAARTQVRGLRPPPEHANLSVPSEILWKIISACKRAGIVTEDLVDPSKDENDEEQVYRGLCRLPDVPGSRRRRIDFLVVNWKAKGAALLYYTVSASSTALGKRAKVLYQGDDIVSSVCFRLESS
jgi:hypothetical protein